MNEDYKCGRGAELKDGYIEINGKNFKGITLFETVVVINISSLSYKSQFKCNHEKEVHLTVESMP